MNLLDDTGRQDADAAVDHAFWRVIRVASVAITITEAVIESFRGRKRFCCSRQILLCWQFSRSHSHTSVYINK